VIKHKGVLNCRFDWSLPRTVTNRHGSLGAIVSGSSAAAKNAELLRKGTVSQSEALLDVSNEALKSAVVSAATSVIVLSVGGIGSILD
jgi:hypothetical protein